MLRLTTITSPWPPPGKARRCARTIGATRCSGPASEARPASASPFLASNPCRARAGCTPPARPSPTPAARTRSASRPPPTPRSASSSPSVPDHAPLEQRQVEHAWEEARTLAPPPKLLVFAAFQFDPEAAKDIDELDPKLAGMQFLKAQMNADLLTDDLKRQRASNESFWLIGQPDVELHQIRKGQNTGKWQVEVRGFDYFNTRTGGVESGGEERIAMWMLDPDYDGRSLFPRQVFFPMAGPRDGWDRLARNLKAEIDQDLIEAYRGTVSLPFESGEHARVAVKIIDDRGIESLKVAELE